MTAVTQADREKAKVISDERAQNFVDCYLPSWAADQWTEQDTRMLALNFRDEIAAALAEKGEQTRVATVKECAKECKDVLHHALTNAGYSIQYISACENVEDAILALLAPPAEKGKNG